MGKKRVHELARELGITNKELIERAQAIGFASVKSPANTLEEHEAKELTQKLSQSAPQTQAARSPKATVLRRRATRTEDEHTEGAYEVVTTRLSGEGAQVIDRKQIDMPIPVRTQPSTMDVESEFLPESVTSIAREESDTMARNVAHTDPSAPPSAPQVVPESVAQAVPSTETVRVLSNTAEPVSASQTEPSKESSTKNSKSSVSAPPSEKTATSEPTPQSVSASGISETAGAASSSVTSVAEPATTPSAPISTASTAETLQSPDLSERNAPNLSPSPSPVLTSPSQNALPTPPTSVSTVVEAVPSPPVAPAAPVAPVVSSSVARVVKLPPPAGTAREFSRPSDHRSSTSSQTAGGDTTGSHSQAQRRPTDRPPSRTEHRTDQQGSYRDRGGHQERSGDRDRSPDRNRPTDRHQDSPQGRDGSRSGEFRQGGERSGDRQGPRTEGRSGEYRPGDRSNRPGEHRQGDRPGEHRQGDRPGEHRQGDRPGDRGGMRTDGRPGEHRQGDRPGDRPGGRPGDRPGGNFDRPSGAGDRSSGPRGPERPRSSGDSFGGPPRWKEPEIPVDFLEDGKVRRKREKGRRSNEYVHEPEEQDDVRQIDRRRSVGQQKDERRGGKSGKDRRQKRGEPQPITAPLSERKRVIKIDGDISVAELAHRMGVRAAELIGVLLRQGIMARINDVLSVEQAAELALLKDYRIEDTSIGVEDILQPSVEADDPALLQDRPPVVTVMGHVDHGKTSLLDAIRETRVASQEAGGITQHVGASVVTLKGGRDIVFLDTPGHEAFTAMRSRGAKSTDIVILVVAADDSVMPQTIEAINHAKAAGVPLVVAVNKIDKPGAEPLRVRTDLMQYGLISEEFGGEHLMVNVSAHTKQGIPELLESVLLQAEMMELQANPNRRAQGVVIESRIEKGRGPVATLLVQSGTIRTGDPIVAGTHFGRIRAMFDHSNSPVSEMKPPYPVQILGLSGTPAPGDTFNCVEDERSARQVAELRLEVLKKQEIAGTQRVRLQDLWGEEQKKELNLILKTDVEGTLEALRQSLLKLKNNEIELSITHSGVGGITENDINLASTTGSVVFGFNVRADNKAQKLAESEGIEIRIYQVIYELIDDVKAAMERQLAPTLQEKPIGQAEIRKIFAIPKIGKIAGCYVTDGKITRGSLIRVYRNNIRVYEGKVATLRRFKNDVKDVASGYECGIQVDGYQEIQENDIIEAYEIEEIATKLELDA